MSICWLLAVLDVVSDVSKVSVVSDSWMIAGMADRGMLPKFFSTRHHHFGTPIYGIAVSCIGIIALVPLSFNQIIDILNLLYCYGQLIEFFAFLWLRKNLNEMSRPYRIPLGFNGCCLMLLFPIVFVVIVVVTNSHSTLLLSGIFTFCGVILYFVLQKLI